jgi:hypothetical protein
MEGHLSRLRISFWSINKRGHQRKLLCLIGWFLKKIFSSETAKLHEPKFIRKQLWKTLYKDCSFRPDLQTNMAATDGSCYWLADFLNTFPLKPIGQMNRNFVENIYGMFFIKNAHFVPIR